MRFGRQKDITRSSKKTWQCKCKRVEDETWVVETVAVLRMMKTRRWFGLSQEVLCGEEKEADNFGALSWPNSNRLPLPARLTLNFKENNWIAFRY